MTLHREEVHERAALHDVRRLLRRRRRGGRGRDPLLLAPRLEARKESRAHG